MGENFERVMEKYFEEFKEKMNNRFRIPPKLVEDYKDDVVLWWIVIGCTFR